MSHLGVTDPVPAKTSEFPANPISVFGRLALMQDFDFRVRAGVQ
jgi:hypothetical protein